ncbi:hypothetical protein [Streptomyces kaniharaensis]|nr:hypothetical protein [Streptomyces kaniharaensis]
MIPGPHRTKDGAPQLGAEGPGLSGTSPEPDGPGDTDHPGPDGREEAAP